MFAFIAPSPLPLLSVSPLSYPQPPRSRPFHHPARPPLRAVLSPSAPLLLAANIPVIQKVADAFNTLNLPPLAVQYGHPVLMAVMVLGLGVPAAALGWLGRLNPNRKAGVNQKNQHQNIVLLFALLVPLGGIGGTLSVAMQGYDIWQSPHAASAALVLLLLAANATLAYSGFVFGSNKKPAARLLGRTRHAYLGAATMAALLLHGGLGLRILLE